MGTTRSVLPTDPAAGERHWIDDGTSCRATSALPGTAGTDGVLQHSPMRHHTSWWKRGKCVFRAYEVAELSAPGEILKETGCQLHDLLEGLLPGILQMLAVVGVTAFVGAAAGGVVGFFCGGVGAVPGVAAGGELGFDAGVAILSWLGLGFLLKAMVSGLGELLNTLKSGVTDAWDAAEYQSPEQERQINRAGQELARCGAILFRLILQGIVAYLMKEGVTASTKNLAANETVGAVVSKLKASRLGEGFGDWVEKNAGDLLRNEKLQPPQAVQKTASEVPTASSGASRARPNSAAESEPPPNTQMPTNQPAAEPAPVINPKINKQMARRGWNEQSIQDTIAHPHAVSPAENKATGGKATAYFNQDGSYVVKDNATNDVLQISNRNDPNWVPDPTISNPYRP